MPSFERRDFVYLSSFSGPGLTSAERALVPVFSELVRRGANVHLIVPHGSDLIEPARAAGAKVAPYRFAKKNKVRTISRMRKYLRRHDPVIAHATGFEASMLLRLAARPLSVGVVDTLTAEDWPPRGRNRGARRARLSSWRRTATMTDAVFVDSAALAAALEEIAYDPAVVTVLPQLGHVADVTGDGEDDPVAAVVAAYLAAYERLARRWQGPGPARGPRRYVTVRRIRRDARKAARREA